jgi:hypothetical protein
MHATLWAAAWTRETAELAIPEVTERGLEIIEFPLLEREKIDAPHSRKLFEKFGIEPTASLCLPALFRALPSIKFRGRLVVESFVTLPPEIAATLSVWRPLALDRHEVFQKGVPFLKGLAKVHGLL